MFLGSKDGWKLLSAYFRRWVPTCVTVSACPVIDGHLHKQLTSLLRGFKYNSETTVFIAFT